MSEDKRAGKKKYLQKQKFKNQIKIPSKIKLQEKLSESISRTLDKNWDRYDEPEPQPFEEEYSTTRDFKFLSENPMSQGGYFQFKKDKQFLPKNDAVLEIDSLFELNMNVINMSLLTIPFYQRLNIEKSVFNDQQLKTMNRTAKENDAKYTSFLENENEEPSDNIDTSNIIEEIFEERPRSSSPLLQKISDACDNIDKMVLNNDQKTDKIVLNKDQKTEEMEAWLDDILD